LNDVTRPFLTAEWRNLLMLNYELEPAMLRAYVPAGTELDTWQGRTFVSLVAFLFADTRVLGVPIPGHRTFEEVNLRFYVKRHVGDDVRRAVVFIREVVPRVAIATVARLTYNEPYVALPMRHSYGEQRHDGIPETVEYQWKVGNAWTTVRATAGANGMIPSAGSQEEFITEHYWGYTRQRDGGTIEYRVAHPQWRVWPVQPRLQTTGLSSLYGTGFSTLLDGAPTSAFIADGSAVAVYLPTRLSVR
jgi:uncharacterized protein YqjF (DUF2071 family)